MFAVYPESPRQKSTSPWLYILGGCGGCALIAVIVVVGLGVWGYGKAKDVVAGLQEQPKTVEKFLGNLKAHQYPSAVTLMSPEGQQALPEIGRAHV